MFADLIDKNINAPEVAKIFSTYEVSAIKDTYGGLNIYDYPSHGICFYFNEENTLITIFLYSAGCDDHSQYTGKLPHELSFNDNRDSVFNLLGPPENFGAKWDRYYFETHYVHLEYAANQRISLVTIMSPSFTETAR